MTKNTQKTRLQILCKDSGYFFWKKRAFSAAFFLALLLFSVLSWAQSTFIPHDPDYYHLIDRFQIKFQSKKNRLFNGYKPIRRVDLNHFLAGLEAQHDRLSPADRYNRQYLLNDNWQWSQSAGSENEKSWWDLFYTKKSDLFYYQSDNLTLRVNPVAYFTVGADNRENDLLYTNTRGVEAFGTIDKKIGFYTFLSTTQAQFPRYVTDYVKNKKAFPNEGFWKEIPRNARAYDFFHARGYFTFGLTQSINIQAGYDKQFIGNGMRSMVLSDFSSPSLFLKINTQTGPFQYTNLFTELIEDVIFSRSGKPFDGKYPKKFLASHRLGLQLTPNFELGFYEMVVSKRASFDYLNPIVFYRAIEHQRGSPDNILLGIDFKANLKKKYQVYGQLIIDEFVIKALRAGNGDWRNKFGVQLGGKWLDVAGIENLDLQAEFNTARPFIYAYEKPALSLTGYRNPLAHPLGANFAEWILAVRYQPVKKLRISGRLVRSRYGKDSPETSFGGNLMRTTHERPGNLGNHTGQGIRVVNSYMEAIGSYQLLHNLFIDAQVVYRHFVSADAKRNQNSFIPSLSLRWNVPVRQHVF